MVSRREIGTHSVLNVKAVVAAFNQEKALIRAFSVIVKTDGSSAALLITCSDLDMDSRDSFIKELQMCRHSAGQTTWPRHERLGPFQSLYTAAAGTNWVVNCNQWMEPIQSDIFVCKGDLLIQTLLVSHFIISDGDCVLQKEQHEILVVKLREREGQRVDSGRSLKSHLQIVDYRLLISFS